MHCQWPPQWKAATGICKPYVPAQWMIAKVARVARDTDHHGRHLICQFPARPIYPRVSHGCYPWSPAIRRIGGVCAACAFLLALPGGMDRAIAPVIADQGAEVRREGEHEFLVCYSIISGPIHLATP